MLTGVRVEIEGETITLVATDRFRFAVRELQWKPEQPDISAVALVPAKTSCRTPPRRSPAATWSPWRSSGAAPARA